MNDISVKVTADTDEFVEAIEEATEAVEDLQTALEKLEDAGITINVGNPAGDELENQIRALERDAR